MANDIANILIIDGDADKVAKVFEFMHGVDEQGVERHIDFDKIVPMPEELNIESSSRYDEAREYVRLLSHKENGRKLSPEELAKIKRIDDMYKDKREEWDKFIEGGIKQLKNILNYGAKDWYDWRCTHWGTKWNAYDQERVDDNTIEFNTAWCAPRPVIAKLSELFPDVSFELTYADEEAGYNTGVIEAHAGITTVELPIGGSDRAMELYFTTHEWERDEWTRENGRWTRIDD